MDMSIDVAPSPRPGKMGARRKVSACLHTLYPLLRMHNAMSADGGRRVSDATRRERAEFAIRTVRLLHELGYLVKDIHRLKPKHIGAIVRSWESRGFSAAAMQKYLAFLGTICRWIGKPAIVGKLTDHLVEPSRGKRCRYAVKDMSWSARTDTWTKIAEIMADDVRVGLMLVLMWAFALRAREAWLFEPHRAVDYVGGMLRIRRGTKGGRPRDLDLTADWLDDPDKLALLKHAKTYASASTGTLIPADMSFLAWQSHFYRVLRRHGVSRATDHVAHGLRHQTANDLYEAMTGRTSPVRGGEAPETSEEKAKERAARHEIAKILGHGRIQVTASYYGTRRPRNADSTDTALARKKDALQKAASEADTLKRQLRDTTQKP